MKLKSLKIKNFRSYINETTITIDKLTAIVGKNDAGKSTILEALEIFFNNELVKIESADAAHNGNAQDVRITCIFENLPTNLTIDSRAETSLANEYLLNTDGDLEVVKIFNCLLKTPTVSINVNCNYPSIPSYNDLHKLKNDDLKLRLVAVGASTEGIDQRSNVQIRKAIWNHQPLLNLQPTLVSLDEEDGKKVWTKLKEELPLYALFQSDRSSKDDDNEVQDPMKLAVKEAISSVKKELEHIKNIVQTKAQEVAKKNIGQIKRDESRIGRRSDAAFQVRTKMGLTFQAQPNR